MPTSGKSKASTGSDVDDTVGAEFQAFQVKNAAKVEAIVKRVGAKRFSALHWDLVDELKGVLGAQAANASSDDASEQEDAIDAAESWVADNVSQGGLEATVAMALWLRGMDDGELLFGPVEHEAAAC